MKRFVFTAIAPLLLFVTIFTSSCNGGSGPTEQVVSCLGNIGIKVVTSMISDDVPLTIASLLTVVPDCINAGISVFGPAPSSNPSSTQVDIAQSTTDSSSTGSVNSNTWSNCSYYPQTLVFNFSVPFEMVVGQQDAQDSFNSSPTGNSDNELVAQQVFERFGSLISSTTTNGPSQSIEWTVPAQTQVTLTLPIQIFYKEGEGQVTHTDGSTTDVSWFFIDGYQQTGQITANSSGC